MCNAHAKDYVIYDYINSIEHNECSFSDVAEHKIKIITSLTTFILTKVYFYSVLPWLVWSQCTHISANACYMDVSYLDEIDQLREMLSSHCWGVWRNAWCYSIIKIDQWQVTNHYCDPISRTHKTISTLPVGDIIIIFMICNCQPILVYQKS